MDSFLKMQRITRQRRVILDALRESTAHPTADELYQVVRKTMPHISLGTVYRNLDILAQCGMAIKLSAAGGPTRYDGNTLWHDHIRCTVCGKLDDTGPVILQLEREPTVRKTGYRITGYRLEIEGICPVCHKTKRMKNRSRRRTVAANKKKEQR